MEKQNLDKKDQTILWNQAPNLDDFVVPDIPGEIEELDDIGNMMSDVPEIDKIISEFLDNQKSKAECYTEFRNEMNLAMQSFDFYRAKIFLSVIVGEYAYQKSDLEIFNEDFLPVDKTKGDEYFWFAKSTISYHQNFLSVFDISGILVTLIEEPRNEYTTNQQEQLLDCLQEFCSDLLQENYSFEEVWDVYSFLLIQGRSDNILETEIKNTFFENQYIESQLQQDNPVLLDEILESSDLSKYIKVVNSDIPQNHLYNFLDKNAVSDQISKSLKYCEDNKKYRLGRLLCEHLELVGIYNDLDPVQANNRRNKKLYFEEKETEDFTSLSYKEFFDIIRSNNTLVKNNLLGQISDLERELTRFDDPDVDIDQVRNNLIGKDFSIEGLKTSYLPEQDLKNKYLSLVRSKFGDDVADQEEAEDYSQDELELKYLNIYYYSDLISSVNNRPSDIGISFEDLMIDDEDIIIKRYLEYYYRSEVFIHRIFSNTGREKTRLEFISNRDNDIGDIKTAILKSHLQTEIDQLNYQNTQDESVIIVSNLILDIYGADLLKNVQGLKVKKRNTEPAFLGDMGYSFTDGVGIYNSLDRDIFYKQVDNLVNHPYAGTEINKIVSNFIRYSGKSRSQGHSLNRDMDIFVHSPDENYIQLVRELIKIYDIKPFNTDRADMHIGMQDFADLLLDKDKLKGMTIKIPLSSYKGYSLTPGDNYKQNLLTDFKKLKEIQLSFSTGIDVVRKQIEWSDFHYPPSESVTRLEICFTEDAKSYNETQLIINSIDQTNLFKNYPNLTSIEYIALDNNSVRDKRYAVEIDQDILASMNNTGGGKLRSSATSDNYAPGLPDDPSIIVHKSSSQQSSNLEQVPLSDIFDSYNINNNTRNTSNTNNPKELDDQASKMFKLPSNLSYFKSGNFSSIQNDGSVAKSLEEHFDQPVNLQTHLTDAEKNIAEQQDYWYNLSIPKNQSVYLPLAKGFKIYSMKPENQNISIRQNSQGIYEITNLSDLNISFQLNLFYDNLSKTQDPPLYSHTQKFLGDFPNKPNIDRFFLKDFTYTSVNNIKTYPDPTLTKTNDPDEIAENIKYYIQTQSYYCLNDNVSDYYKQGNQNLDVQKDISPQYGDIYYQNYYDQIEKRIFPAKQQGKDMMLMDCDLANTYAIGLLRDCGIPARLAIGYHDFRSPTPHAWVEYRDGEERKILDCTPAVVVDIK